MSQIHRAEQGTAQHSSAQHSTAAPLLLPRSSQREKAGAAPQRAVLDSPSAENPGARNHLEQFGNAFFKFPMTTAI